MANEDADSQLSIHRNPGVVLVTFEPRDTISGRGWDALQYLPDEALHWLLHRFDLKGYYNFVVLNRHAIDQLLARFENIHIRKNVAPTRLYGFLENGRYYAMERARQNPFIDAIDGLNRIDL